MDTQQITAPSRGPSSVPPGAVRSGAARSGGLPSGAVRSGVVHINSRHSSRFTVVGNHLAQHRELSLTAIGLAAHIQSLPAGAKIGIKVLAERFPESEHRIASALRELEAHGYLQRTRARLPGGQVVTRTVSYNQPGTRTQATTPVQPLPPPESVPVPTPGPQAPRSDEPTAASAPEPPAPLRAAPQDAVRQDAAAQTPVRQEPPHAEDRERQDVAAALLAGLHRHEPRLLLSEHDVRRLAPAVADWLERGVAPAAVHRTLTAGLPEPVKHPAALLAHRLTELLPPPLPAAPPRPDPLQTCEDCDRAFRAPAPGRCRACRSDLKEAA